MTLLLNKQEAEEIIETVCNALCEREEVKDMSVAEAQAFELGVRSVQLEFRKKLNEYI